MSSKSQAQTPTLNRPHRGWRWSHGGGRGGCTDRDKHGDSWVLGPQLATGQSVAINSLKAQGGCDGKEEVRASQRGRGVGRRGIRRNQSLDPSGHVKERKEFDHITIYPPDRPSLPPPASTARPHTQTSVPAPLPHSPRTQRGGQEPAPEPYSESFLLAPPPLTLPCRWTHRPWSHTAQRTRHVLREKLQPLL